MTEKSCCFFFQLKLPHAIKNLKKFLFSLIITQAFVILFAVIKEVRFKTTGLEIILFKRGNKLILLVRTKLKGIVNLFSCDSQKLYLF